MSFMSERSSKDSADRQREFVETAIKLFSEKGYENTTIDDIVAAMGVAKGLFYYYFKTKDDVLYALVDDMVDGYAKNIDRIMFGTYENPVDRLIALMTPNASNTERSKLLMGLFREEKNRGFHNLLVKKITLFLEPALVKTITQGISEKALSVKYPEQTAHTLVLLLVDLAQKKVEHTAAQESLRDDFCAVWDIVGRLLGVDLSSYHVFAKCPERSAP